MDLNSEHKKLKESVDKLLRSKKSKEAKLKEIMALKERQAILIKENDKLDLQLDKEFKSLSD